MSNKKFDEKYKGDNFYFLNYSNDDKKLIHFVFYNKIY